MQVIPVGIRMANPYDYFVVLTSTASPCNRGRTSAGSWSSSLFDGDMADVWRHISEVLEESQKESFFLMQLQRSL